MRRGSAALGFALVAAIAGVVACSGGSVQGSSGGGLVPDARRASLHDTPIKHVIIAIQENRSFDNLFATFPGADGTTTGKAAAMPPSIAQSCSHPIEQPTTVPLQEVHLATSFDLGHIYRSFKQDFAKGKMDGFDLGGANANGSGPPACLDAYQYVNPSDVTPYWEIARQYVLADHLFQTQASSSFTAHQDLVAGGTQIAWNEAVIDNPSYFPWGCDANKTVVTGVIKKFTGKVLRYGGPFPCFTYATMRDLLDAKGVSWKFYAMAVHKESSHSHGDTAGIWSAFDAIKAVRYSPEWHTNVTRNNTVFFTDLANGRLPAVSWITPDGINSDHPQERSDTGPSWIASIVNAIGRSRYWDSSAIVILWDDWGGFYDHVPPPRPHYWQGGPGFRVPMLIVSPYVKPHVEHTVYQFGSILKFIEANWDLGSLGTNDQQSTGIGNAFDFKMAPRKFKPISAKYSLDFFLYQKPSGLLPDKE